MKWIYEVVRETGDIYQEYDHGIAFFESQSLADRLIAVLKEKDPRHTYETWIQSLTEESDYPLPAPSLANVSPPSKN